MEAPTEFVEAMKMKAAGDLATAVKCNESTCMLHPVRKNECWNFMYNNVQQCATSLSVKTARCVRIARNQSMP